MIGKGKELEKGLSRTLLVWEVLFLKVGSRLTDAHFIIMAHNLCICRNLSCMYQIFYSKN